VAADVILYEAREYAPGRVAHRYVRPARGSLRKGGFIIFECAAPKVAGIGAGPTLREVLTDGEAIPEDVRKEARARKTTVRLD
jgi:hypothetical protein